MKSCNAALRALGLICVLMIVMALGNASHAQLPSHTMKTSPFIDNNVNGFWEYIPKNYAVDINQTYPLLIFFHGYGDSGSSPDSATLGKVLSAGTPRIISNGQFPDSFNVGGKIHKFIVISPQIKDGFDDQTRSSKVAASTVDAIIEYAKTAYRVDRSRIYLCGLSMGGGIAWDYAGTSFNASNKLAAIAVAAAATDIDTAEATNIALSHLPVIATHNTVDPLISYTRTLANIANVKQSIKKLNEAAQQNGVDTGGLVIEPVAFYWPTPGVGGVELDPHNAWSRTFEDLQTGTTAGGNLRDSIGINVYEWLLGFERSEESILPVAWQSFSIQETNNIILIQWATSRELNVKRFIVEKSRDGVNWVEVSSLVPNQAAGALKAYSVNDNQPYAETSFYRIKQVDFDGKVAYSSIKVLNRTGVLLIKIYPNPFIEQITLDMPKSDVATTVNIKLINSNGAVLRTEGYKTSRGTGSSITMQGLQNLSRGIYYVIIENEDGDILMKKSLIKK